MVGIGFRERKYLILGTLALLIARSFGIFDSFFTFRIVNFISISAVVGFVGLWVLFQFYQHRT